MTYETPKDARRPGDGKTNVPAGGADEANALDWFELQQLWACVCDLTKRLADENSRLSRLAPHHCVRPETQDAYASKAELEKELSAAVEELKRWLPELQRRVVRGQRNWDRVRSDTTKLKEPELLDGYSEAEDAARKEYMLALYYRDRTATVIGNAQSVLEVARRKVLLGPELCGQGPSEPGGSRPASGGTVPKDDLGPPKDDRHAIDGLLSLGPLRDSTEIGH